MDDRPELTKEMNIVLQTGLTYQHQGVDLGVDDLDQLTDLEEQSAVLEENLRRTEIEILRSRISMPQRLRLRNVRNLHRRLKELQAKLKTAIEILEGMPTRKYMGGTFFSRRSMPEIKELVRERGPLRFQSCPDIPSEDLLDFGSLKKWRSLNRTISFKRSFEDMLIILDKNLNVLEMSLKSINSKLVESSEHRNAESEIPTQRHRSQNNNPEVSPSQTMPRAAPQPIGTVQRATIQEPPSPVITTAMKTVSAESSGNPSFSPNISTAIYKSMAASCAAILIFL